MDKFVKRKIDQNQEDSDDQAAKDERKRKQRMIKNIYHSASPQWGPMLTNLFVSCLQTLSNDAMKPAKLRRHLTTMHSELASKPKEYFERQKEHYLKQKGKMMACTIMNEKALRASDLVALRIARSKKPHTITEELILASADDMCEVVLGNQKLKAIPLSDNTLSRRIADMSEDVRCQLIARLQHVKFAIQLDESTDIANAAQLLVYVQYCLEGEVVEDFLFCKSLPGRTTGEELFRVLDAFFEESGLAFAWTALLR